MNEDGVIGRLNLTMRNGTNSNFNKIISENEEKKVFEVRIAMQYRVKID